MTTPQQPDYSINRLSLSSFKFRLNSSIFGLSPMKTSDILQEILGQKCRKSQIIRPDRGWSGQGRDGIPRPHGKAKIPYLSRLFSDYI